MLLLSPWWREEMLNVKSKCLAVWSFMSHFPYWFPTGMLCCLERHTEGQCFCLVWVCLWSIFSNSCPFFYLSAPAMSVSPSPLRGSPAVTADQFNSQKHFPLEGQRSKCWKKTQICSFTCFNRNIDENKKWLHDFFCIINKINCSVYKLIRAFDNHGDVLLPPSCTYKNTSRNSCLWQPMYVNRCSLSSACPLTRKKITRLSLPFSDGFFSSSLCRN